MTFQVGDKVIYPNHGLGVVQKIESRTIMGMTCGFYQLRMVSNETTVLVPVENADSVGLRKAVGNSEVDRLYSLLGDGKIDTGQNWKGRFKDNSDRMRTGSLFAWSGAQSLSYLSRSKNLSPRECMLDRDKFLVTSGVRRTREELPAVRSRSRKPSRLVVVEKRTIARQARQGPRSFPARRPRLRRGRSSGIRRAAAGLVVGISLASDTWVPPGRRGAFGVISERPFDNDRPPHCGPRRPVW